MVHEVKTLAELQRLITETNIKILVVDYGANWCGPCNRFGPIFTELAEKYKQFANFVKVDVDENTEAASEKQITSMPTFEIYFKQELKQRFSGANKEKLCQAIDTCLHH